MKMNWNDVLKDPSLTMFLSYSALHYVLDRYMIPKNEVLFPHKTSITTNTKSLRDFYYKRLYFIEKIPSTMNALLVSIPALKALLFTTKDDEHSFHNDIIHTYPPQLDMVFARHLGFTLYDTTIMAISQFILGKKEHVSVWFHHLFGILGVFFIRQFQKLTFFPGMFCPSELTVVASNLIWVMQHVSVDLFSFIQKNTVTSPSSALVIKDRFPKFYFWVCVLRMVLFLCVRTFAGPLALYHALNTMTNHHSHGQETVENESGYQKGVSLLTHSSAEMDHPVKTQDQKKRRDDHSLTFFEKLKLLKEKTQCLHPIVRYLCTCNVLLFSGLNVYWTLLTIRSVINEWNKLTLNSKIGNMARLSTVRKEVSVHHI